MCWYSIALHVLYGASGVVAPGKSGTGIDDGERECVFLNGSSFYWDISRAARRQADSSVCLIVLFFTTSGESQIKHNNEQLIMICGIKMQR